MEVFRTKLEIASIATPNKRHGISGVVINAGSEYNWFPETLLVELSSLS